MSGYVDIHTHVLPGIDDGPPELESALEMVRAAADAGTETLVATPHLRPDFPNVHVHELATRCLSLREAIEREGIAMRLVSGAEVSLLWALEASDEELTLATFDQRGTDLLVETPAVDVPGFDRLLYDLRLRGLRITLAHPERSREFQRDASRLIEIADQGVLLQINADSLLGATRNSSARRLGQQLCDGGRAHALASDGHRSTSWRPVTLLAPAARAAAALVGAERARWMAQAAPAAIVDGVELPKPPAIVHERRRGRLFGRR